MLHASATVFYKISSVLCYCIYVTVVYLTLLFVSLALVETWVLESECEGVTNTGYPTTSPPEVSSSDQTHCTTVESPTPVLTLLVHIVRNIIFPVSPFITRLARVACVQQLRSD